MKSKINSEKSSKKESGSRSEEKQSSMSKMKSDKESKDFSVSKGESSPVSKVEKSSPSTKNRPYHLKLFFWKRRASRSKYENSSYDKEKSQIKKKSAYLSKSNEIKEGEGNKRVEEKKVEKIGKNKESKERNDQIEQLLNPKVLESARRAIKSAKKRKKRKERRSALYRRRVLSEFLLKAGHSTKPKKLQKVVFYTSFVLVSLLTLYTMVLASLYGKSATGLLIFYSGLWTFLFAFIYLFIWMVIYIYLDIRIFKRTNQLEEVLPDFLQLASANISAGMPVDRALWFAVRPNFGVLAKEIEEVAKATLAGKELSESLHDFTEKYDSVMLKRSVSILLEGMAAGGEIAELLNKISLDIQETKIMKKEMSANVTTYAIFITFASIIMAPILFGLATELLTIIVKIMGSLDLSSSSQSFFTLNISTSPKMISNFSWFSITTLTISSLMSASIVSVIKKGRIKEGFRNLPIFVVVSLITYFIAVKLLHYLLGGLL